MRPQQAQKAQTIELDAAIDRVAKQLTHLDEDPLIAARIVAALPDRNAWRGWLFGSWVPRLAVLAVAVLGGFAWTRTSLAPATIAPLSVVATAPVVALRAPLPPTGRLIPAGKAHPDGPALPDGNSLPGRDAADHEFSVPAIPGVAALEVDALAPADLPEDAPLTIESLEIEALPLTADFSSR